MERTGGTVPRPVGHALMEPLVTTYTAIVLWDAAQDGNQHLIAMPVGFMGFFFIIYFSGCQDFLFPLKKIDNVPLYVISHITYCYENITRFFRKIEEYLKVQRYMFYLL